MGSTFQRIRKMRNEIEQMRNALLAKATRYSSIEQLALEETGIEYNNGYAYMKQILEEPHPYVYIIKGAQLGFTRGMLNIVFWDMLQERNILYLLPTTSQTTEFSAGRFNPLVMASKTLCKICGVDNVRLKTVGKASLYLRGAQSRAALKEIPIDTEIMDERDEMEDSMVELALERLSGSKSPKEWRLSTPGLPNVGIDKDIQDCDIYKFSLTCTGCKKSNILEFDIHADVDNKCYVCEHCKKKWTEVDRLFMLKHGKWVLEKKGNGKHGYKISQMYSPTVSMEKVIDSYLSAKNDPIKKKEFYNSKLGEAYEPEGARLSEGLIENAVEDIKVRTNYPRVSGTDVSQNLHYSCVVAITEYGLVVESLTRESWEGVSRIMNRTQCSVGDANPERAKMRELTLPYPNRHMCLFTKTKSDLVIDETNGIIQVRKSDQYDEAYSLFREDRVRIIPGLSEYRTFVLHLRNLIRDYVEENGIYVAKYVSVGEDHYADAFLYAYIASKLWGGPQRENIVGRL